MLDNRKEGLGVMSTREALDLAAEQDVDLIMLNPEAKPPLVRLVQLNKLKYEQSKAEQDQRKKQRESRQAFCRRLCLWYVCLPAFTEFKLSKPESRDLGCMACMQSTHAEILVFSNLLFLLAEVHRTLIRDFIARALLY